MFCQSQITLRMRNHWSIWSSLHRRDWINSVELSSSWKNLARPKKSYFRNLSCLYLSTLTCRSCPVFVPAASLLSTMHRYSIAIKIILQAECSRIVSVLTCGAPVWFPQATKNAKERLKRYEKLCLKNIFPLLFGKLRWETSNEHFDWSQHMFRDLLSWICQ